MRIGRPPEILITSADRIREMQYHARKLVGDCIQWQLQAWRHSIEPGTQASLADTFVSDELGWHMEMKSAADPDAPYDIMLR